MLWNMFAREFSQAARDIARTVSNANLESGGSAPSDERRPSMRLAIQDLSKATSDTSKQERKKTLLIKMAFVFAVDVVLLVVIFASILKAVINGESSFGSDHGVTTRVVIFICGMGPFGVTLEALACYIRYKELRGIELTEAQKSVSESVFDVSFEGTRAADSQH